MSINFHLLRCQSYFSFFFFFFPFFFFSFFLLLVFNGDDIKYKILTYLSWSSWVILKRHYLFDIFHPSFGQWGITPQPLKWLIHATGIHNAGNVSCFNWTWPDLQYPNTFCCVCQMHVRSNWWSTKGERNMQVFTADSFNHMIQQEKKSQYCFTSHMCWFSPHWP